MSFEITALSDFCVERCLELNLFHGFYGKPFDFYKDELRKTLDIPLEEEIMVPNQIHGDQIIDLRYEAWDNSKEADAVVMNTHERGIIGVKTADCLPILICSKDMIGAVHAGWKGISIDIVGKVLDLFREQKDVLCIIGPHAQTYEVKSDVIEAMGGDAVYKKHLHDTFHLDLKETLLRKIKNFTNVTFFVSNQCTINSSFFHSYRRDGALRGSNLSVIATPRSMF